MKVKWLYLIWMVLIFGSLAGIAIYFYIREEFVTLWIVEGVLVLGLLISVLLYRKLIRPYETILSGMLLLKEQDFSTFLRPAGNREANELINVFNRMIKQLRKERFEVREKNQFLDLLIQASPQGILILDFHERIRDINPAGLKLLNIPTGKKINGFRLKEMDFELAPVLANLRKGDSIVIRSGGANMFKCSRSSFVDQGYDHPFILVEELTRELLQFEKESYERIIRMMSHEVNNSTGAIGATLHVVSDIIKQEKSGWEDVLPAVEASYQRCGNLSEFIGNLAQVVRLPKPSFSHLFLNKLVLSVEALIRLECEKRNISLTIDLTEEANQIYADGIQMEQVLMNIIKNAWEAIGQNGCISISTSVNPLSVIIEDNGPGLSEEAQEKLFTPFFTTKSAGQGIGLTFVREVLVNHNFRFNLRTTENRTRFEIIFD